MILTILKYDKVILDAGYIVFLQSNQMFMLNA